MNELRDRHHCVARNWFFYGGPAPMLVLPNQAATLTTPQFARGLRAF